MVHHEMRHLRYRHMRAERAGAGPHDLLRGLIASLVKLGSAKQAKDHPLLVHDHARSPSGRTDAIADIADRLVQTARRYVPAGHVAGARALSAGALDRKTGREPVEFPVDVVVDLRVPQALEPPRGSWTEVSGGVPAVDDDRPGRSELPSGLGLDLPEG